MAFRYPPEINSPPVYVDSIDDNLRVGSFVHIKLKGQSDGTTTIARIHARLGPTGMRFVLYPPLFPHNNRQHPTHPSLPKHHHRKILLNIGSRNTELYESEVDYDVPYNASAIILHPAFVFSIEEFKEPKNSWAHGLKNVFFVRFRCPQKHTGIPEDSIHSPLLPLKSYDQKLCFPNQHTKRVVLDEAIRPPRCFHESAFVGLFMIRKSITKILNKSSGQAELQEVVGAQIGLVPTETWTYIVHMSRSQGIKVHVTKGSASYMDVDPDFTRKKVKIQYPTTIIRYQTNSELQFLREMLGFCSTYGSTEKKPTLSDGDRGLPLKREHRLTLVNGSGNENNDPDAPFKIRTRQQRVDLCWSNFHFRVIVGYQQYHYSVNRDGELTNEPPTEHLASVLGAEPKDKHVLRSDKSKNQSPKQAKQAGLLKDPSQGDSPDTFNKILQASDSDCSSDEGNPNDLPNIHIGDQFTDDDNVYEVLSVQVKAKEPFALVRVVGGDLFDHSLPLDKQYVRKWDDLEEVMMLIEDFN